MAARPASLAIRFECGLRSAPAPFLRAEGFELRVGVVAGGQRPKIDPPRITGARTWTIGTEIRPITRDAASARSWPRRTCSCSGFAWLPARAGTLEIPAIQAQLKGRSGRSQPKSVSIQAVPLAGPPGRVSGGCRAGLSFRPRLSPKVVRVGQELDFRIKVTGPAAWGMTDRPDLGRLRTSGTRPANRAQAG